MRHGPIVDNIVSNLYVQFNDDRLWNEKVLVLWKSDNNNPENNNNVRQAIGTRFQVQKKCITSKNGKPKQKAKT